MAWHRPGDKPLSEPMMVSLLTHTCVSRPQWVKSVFPHENTASHTVHTWHFRMPNPKQWLMIYISSLMTIIRCRTNILTIIKREMGELKTHSLIDCIKITERMDLILETHPAECTITLEYLYVNWFNLEMTFFICLWKQFTRGWQDLGGYQNINILVSWPSLFYNDNSYTREDVICIGTGPRTLIQFKICHLTSIRNSIKQIK